MTLTVSALTNDRARLEVKSATFRNDRDAARMIAQAWEAQGFRVVLVTEG